MEKDTPGAIDPHRILHELGEASSFNDTDDIDIYNHRRHSISTNTYDDSHDEESDMKQNR
eukprot:UN06246